MEAIMPEITLGEIICIRIKQIYFSDESWPDCYQKVANKFTVFKRIMRKIYPDTEIVEILKKVQKFDTMDIQEIFSMEGDYLKDDSVRSENGLPKYDKRVIWVPVPVDKPELLGDIRKMLVA